MLSTKEINAVLGLYRIVKDQEKQLVLGRIPLEITYSVYGILRRLYESADYIQQQRSSSPSSAGQFSSEFLSLLKICAKVQYVVIDAHSSVAGGDAAIHHNHHPSDSSSPTNNKDSAAVVLDLALFANLFSLKLRNLHLQSVKNALQVTELFLASCRIADANVFQDAFLCLRAIEYDRTHVVPEQLSLLRYTLRRFSIRNNDRKLERVLWKGGNSAAKGDIAFPWAALTHVSIRTHEKIFDVLDRSWAFLTNLTYLSLQSLGIEELRDLSTLAKCKNMISLDLSFNRLSHLASIASVVPPGLQRLDLSDNPFLTSAHDIAELTELRVLSLERTMLLDWNDIKLIGNKCLKLQVLKLRSCSILEQKFNSNPKLYVPYVAALFGCRPLLVDGERSEKTKGKIDAKFFHEHMDMLQEHGVTPQSATQSLLSGLSGLGSRSSKQNYRASSAPHHHHQHSTAAAHSTPVLEAQRDDEEERAAARALRASSPQARVSNRRASSTGRPNTRRSGTSETGSDAALAHTTTGGGGGGVSRATLRRSTGASTTASRRGVRRVEIVPDRVEEAPKLPPSQLAALEDKKAPGYVDIDGLVARDHERWLISASAESVAHRAAASGVSGVDSPQMSTSAQRRAAQRKAAAEALQAKKAAPAPSNTTPAAAATTTTTTTPGSSTTNRSMTAANASSSSTSQQQQPHHDDEAEDENAAVIVVTPLQSPRGGGGVATAINAIQHPRQAPPRPPTQLFQSFLLRLMSMDWTVIDKRTDTTVRAFQGGCQAMLSAICIENEHLWGVKEEDLTSAVPHHTAVEVFFHDQNDVLPKQEPEGRHHGGKTLIRLVEYHTGYARMVRLETAELPAVVTTNTAGRRLTAHMFPPVDWRKGRPKLIVALATPSPTQPTDAATGSSSYNGVSGGTSLFSPGRPATRQSSDLESVRGGPGMFLPPAMNPEHIRVARNILRVARPKILAGFVAPTGEVADSLLDQVRQQLLECHSRLCEAGILREWPMSLDEEPVMRDTDLSVPLKITVEQVLERIKRHARSNDLTRERIGCPKLLIEAGELKVFLTTVIFPHLAADELLATHYVNIAQVDDESQETAVLMVITNRVVLLAYDKNFDLSNGAGPLNQETAFSKCDELRVLQLQRVIVSYHLQTLRLGQFLIHTRDAAVTLSILGALQIATASRLVAPAASTGGAASPNAKVSKEIEILVHACPYVSITTAPWVFCVNVFVRLPLGSRGGGGGAAASSPTASGSASRAFPLRHIPNGSTLKPVHLLITGTEIVLLAETMGLTKHDKVEIVERMPRQAVIAFGAPAGTVNPLVFSLIINNLKQSAREQWIFAAQSANTVASVYCHLRSELGGSSSRPTFPVVELTEKQFSTGKPPAL